MLVLTPMSTFPSGYSYPYPVVSPVAIQNDYLEAVAQARAEAARRMRQQELRRRQVEVQHALAAAYQEQVLRERQHYFALTRQREEAYLRTLLEAQKFERAERLRRAKEHFAAIASLNALLDPKHQVHQPQQTPREVRAPSCAVLPQKTQHGSVQAPSQASTSLAYRGTSPVSLARERFQHRLEHESNLDIRSAVEGLLSVFPEQPQDASVDRKGKGKAREAPVQPIAGPSSVPQVSTPTSAAFAATVQSSSQPTTGATLKDVLQQRLQNEEDSEVKESLNHLFTTLYGAPKAPTVSETTAPAPATRKQVEELGNGAAASRVSCNVQLPSVP